MNDDDGSKQQAMIGKPIVFCHVKEKKYKFTVTNKTQDNCPSLHEILQQSPS